MNEITHRLSIADMYRLKTEALDALKRFDAMEQETRAIYNALHGYAPFRVEYRYEYHGDDAEIKNIDRTCWRLLVQMADLNRYMLCTEFDKMNKDIEEFRFPVFTVENAEGYISSLRDIIYDNVKTMMRKVYEGITNGHYYTGSGYSSRQKKKRNNNGIDKSFILATGDIHRIAGSFSYGIRPTLTDDLEKLCYLFDSAKLPENTLIEKMRSSRATEGSNEYFHIKVCKNGNTHYTLSDDIRNKLNAYGGNTSLIDKAVKIKVFEEKW